MSFESEFLDLMPHTITRNAFASRDEYASPTYSTAVNSYRARVVYNQTLVRTFKGTEELSKCQAYINCTGSISPFDKITLPDNTIPPILAIKILPDEEGTHHNVVYFG